MASATEQLGIAMRAIRGEARIAGFTCLRLQGPRVPEDLRFQARGKCLSNHQMEKPPP